MFLRRLVRVLHCSAWVGCLFLGAAFLHAQGDFIFGTLAGTQDIAYSPIDGTGNAARFEQPGAVGIDSSGTVYVADVGSIRKITPSGTVTTWIGSGYGGIGGIVFDSADNAYVTATQSCTIMKITPAGVVTTLAGLPGNQGAADGTGSAASFNYPTGLTIDGDGNLFVVDLVNGSVRKVTPAGVVTTFVSNVGLNAIARGGDGNFYATSAQSNSVQKITPAGVVSLFAGSPNSYESGSADGTGSAARLNFPFGITVGAGGNLYVTDEGNATIRQITPAGVVTTVGGMAEVQGFVDGAGNAARFTSAWAIAANTAGCLYVVDQRAIRFGAPSDVPALPVISVQPGNQANISGQNAVFGTTVIGTLPSTYQWQRSVDGGTTWNNLADDATYSGTTTTTLTVAHVTQAMQGDTFRSIVTNAIGPLASNTVVLKIGPGYQFSTLAGGTNGHNDGTGSAAQFNLANAASGTAIDLNGNLFVSDITNHTIRKISPAGVVTTFAGLAGTPGSADGVGTNARFNSPTGLAFDAAGNLFVADGSNNTIREITPAGNVSTFAGSPSVQGSADGTGTSALFNFPSAIAFDRLGNLYVADENNREIRKITPSGIVTTFAGNPSFYGQSGPQRGNNARFDSPVGIGIDEALNVYVLEYEGAVCKITPDGIVTTLAGQVGRSGNVDGSGDTAAFGFATGLAVDGAGSVYVADQLNRTIRMITPAGVVSTLAGTVGIMGNDDGLGTNARFSWPTGIAIARNGDLYVTDSYSQTIRRGTLTGGTAAPVIVTQPVDQTVVAGHLAAFNIAATGLPVPSFQWQISSDGGSSWNNLSNDAIFAGVHSENINISAAAGTLHGSQLRCVVTNAQGTSVSDPAYLTVQAPTSAVAVSTWAGVNDYYGTADGAGTAARFFKPMGIAADQAGNFYVADSGSYTIRKITAGGIVSTFAGMAGQSGSADGTGTAARFGAALGANNIATDNAGNVYVADASNQIIRKITPAGVVTTLAGSPGQTGTLDGFGSSARFNFPAAVAVDAAGNVYVADAGNHTIREILPNGFVLTFAGSPGQAGTSAGTGMAARLRSPNALAIDSSGNLYVAEFSNYIWKITPAGEVTQSVGVGGHYPLLGLCVDASGDFCATSRDDALLLRITADGTLTVLAGVAQTPGAYDGIGNAAQFNQPVGLAMDSTGNLYIADSGNHSIRKTEFLLNGELLSVVIQPTTRTVVIDQSVSFIATLLAGGTSSYQWCKDGVHIAGATNSSYTISHATVADRGSYTVVVNDNSGSIISDPAQLFVSAAYSDLNGDGKADVFLTDTVTGQRAIWLMNGMAISAGVSLGIVPVDWSISGSGDFDGNGKADIFLTNTTTGDRAIWLMNGTAISAGASLGVVPADWKVSGVGDFDGDGKADIVLTNTTTGERAVWLMNGSAISAGASLGILPVAWQVSGVGDFDGDGKADIILTNTTTGERAIWLMNGPAIGAGASLGVLPVAWKISGVGDFDGDGKADIVLTNTTTGDRAIWLMNGTVVGSGAYLNTLSTDWTISQVGDFDGDGKADIFLSNPTTGECAIWLMNGGSIAAGTSLGIFPLEWSVDK